MGVTGKPKQTKQFHFQIPATKPGTVIYFWLSVILRPLEMTFPTGMVGPRVEIVNVSTEQQSLLLFLTYSI